MDEHTLYGYVRMRVQLQVVQMDEDEEVERGVVARCSLPLSGADAEGTWTDEDEEGEEDEKD
jgi:hypothetical protein